MKIILNSRWRLLLCLCILELTVRGWYVIVDWYIVDIPDLTPWMYINAITGIIAIILGWLYLTGELK